MQCIAVFIIVFLMTLRAAGAASGPPQPTRYALLDTHVGNQAKPVKRAVPATSLVTVRAPSPLTTPTLSVTPAARMDNYRLNLNAAWGMIFMDAPQALFHDGEFQGHTGGKPGTFTGLWDLSAGLHADVRVGHLFFEHDEASVRVIPISTTGTRNRDSFQPGFVIGLSTTW